MVNRRATERMAGGVIGAHRTPKNPPATPKLVPLEEEKPR